MKRTIDINDTLDERVESLQSEIKDLLIEYLDANNPDDSPDLYNDLDYDGRVFELVDSSVPIYTAEIDGLYYLYGNDLDQAYEEAGLGDGREDNYKQVAIYCYLERQVAEWYFENADDVFYEWQDAKAAA